MSSATAPRRQHVLVRDLTARGVGNWREHLPKHRVDPVDNRRLRAEVAGQIEADDRNAGDAPGRLCLEEDADLGLAEAVDRLHRIADGEQRAPVARFPAGREPRDQFAVGPRRVLELVDEQVRQPVVDGQQQVAGIVGIAERRQCAQRRLAEIGRAFVWRKRPAAARQSAAAAPAWRRRTPMPRRRRRAPAMSLHRAVRAQVPESRARRPADPSSPAWPQLARRIRVRCP